MFKKGIYYPIIIIKFGWLVGLTDLKPVFICFLFQLYQKIKHIHNYSMLHRC